MRTSRFFMATLKETPADAEIISHQLMLRAGMIRQLSSGIYTWLPMGHRVLTKVANIVRREMNRIEAGEMLMSALQPSDLWEETGRWQDFWELLFKMNDRNERAYYFGPTHEEVITDLIRRELKSYKQLPLILYQIQTKYRDETRPRFGIMRSREFLMKDAYSFHTNTDSLKACYETMHEAYQRIFDTLGLAYRSVQADSGGMGGAVSHEFHVLAESGEDEIVYSEASDFAANKELFDDNDPKLQDGQYNICRGIEVGHIFQLGDKYSQAMNATILNADDERVALHMGCYGIGVSRIVGAAIEQNYDDHGIIWPEAIAPFQIALIPVNYNDETIRQTTDKLYHELTDAGFEVLLDDRDERAGFKFADMDLVGIPHQLVVSNRNLNHNKIEYKNRAEQSKRTMIPVDSVVNHFE